MLYKFKLVQYITLCLFRNPHYPAGQKLRQRAQERSSSGSGLSSAAPRPHACGAAPRDPRPKQGTRLDAARSSALKHTPAEQAVCPPSKHSGCTLFILETQKLNHGKKQYHTTKLAPCSKTPKNISSQETIPPRLSLPCRATRVKDDTAFETSTSETQLQITQIVWMVY